MHSHMAMPYIKLDVSDIAWLPTCMPTAGGMRTHPLEKKPSRIPLSDESISVETIVASMVTMNR